MSWLPISTQTLALYAQFLSQTFKSTSSIKNYICWAKMLHILTDTTIVANAIILFSSILPRADNFDLYFLLIFGLYFTLEKWCAQSSGTHVFVSSHNRFLKHGRLKREQYSTTGGLHPNGVSTDVLESFIRQALSPQFILENISSKRVACLVQLPY